MTSLLVTQGGLKLDSSCPKSWTLSPSQNLVGAAQTISAQLCPGIVWKKRGWQHKTVSKPSCSWTQVFLCSSAVWKEMDYFKEESSLTLTLIVQASQLSIAQFLLFRYYICLENTGIIWENILVALQRTWHLEKIEAWCPQFCLCLEVDWKASRVEKLSQRAGFES